MTLAVDVSADKPAAPKDDAATLPPLPGARLRALARPYRRTLTAVVVLALGDGLARIGFAWMLAAMIAGVLFAGVDAADLALPAALAMGFMVIRALCFTAAEFQAFEIGAGVRRQVRTAVLSDATAPIEDPRSGGTGARATLAVETVEALHGYFARFLPASMVAALLPLAILLAILPFDWIIALLLFVTAPLIPLFMALVGWGAERANQRRFTLLQRLGGRFADRLAGLPTLVLFGRVKASAAEVGDAADAYRRQTMAVLRIAFMSSAVLELFAALGVALVAVYVGFSLLGMIDLGGAPMTLQTGLFALILAPEFYAALRRLAAHYHDVAAARGAVAELPEPQATPAAPSGRMPAPFSEVELDGVGVAGDRAQAQLAPVTARLPASGLVAVTGASGAGKSTLLRLLAGLDPVREGTIRVDGRKLEAPDMAGWQARLVWVPQRPRLFHGSLADNLRLGAGAAIADADLLAALTRLQGGETLLAELPDGLATEVGEHGARLSGGQVQRVALARALIRPAQIMLLDEPTAHLDAAAEQAVIAALRERAAGTLVIAATHAPALITAADRELRIDG